MIVDIQALSLITGICTWVALILTVVSLVDYIAKNHKVITEGEM